MKPYLTCKNISKTFDGATAVESVSIDLLPGEIMSILGPSGCGKTTLLRLIAGFETIDEGEIKIENNIISSNQIHLPPEKRNIGMVFQDYSLFPHMNVEQNITFGLQNYNQDEKEFRLQEILKLIQLVGFEKKLPAELSGGQQQRIALGRTLAPKPSLILLDEPFSNLDAVTRKEVMSDINQIILESKTASILVTHDREEAFSIANKLVVMINGKIFQMDNPNNIYNLPNNIEVAKLVADCNFIQGSIQNKEVVTVIGSFKYESTDYQISDKQIVNTLIRPDDFIITYDPNGSFKITAREFHGPYSISTVLSYQYGFSLKFRDQQNVSFRIGTNVNLVKTNNRNLVVFPK